MGQSPSLETIALDGARKVLAECLQMRAGETLGIIWDDSTEAVFEVLRLAALEANLDVRDARVSLDYEAAFGALLNQELKPEIRDVFEASRGIITCVSDLTSGGRFRHKLVIEGADRGKRLGHIPGANLELLAHAVNINYGPVTELCDDLALALTLGQRVELVTYELDGSGNPVRPHSLKFDLDSSQRSPITSSGVIAVDTWGNLPGGESFIAPIEERAHGTFVLNGALKNFVLAPPDRLLLHFEAGRLCEVEGNGDARAAFERLIESAREDEDPYYTNLAELGIGVNDGISQLTGNALFDEKCAGTAHIAIGANDGFGGLYSSSIHEDFITRHPSLFIDDRPILNKGVFAFEPSWWRETLDRPFCPRTFEDSTRLRRTVAVIHGELGRDGGLRVRRDVAAGRVCQYTIGDGQTSKVLHALYSMVPGAGVTMRFAEFWRLSGEGRDTAERALAILVRHGLISVD